jgi:hypothetical protein
MHGESYVVAEQIQCLKFGRIVKAIALPAAQGDDPDKFAADPEGSDTLEKLGSNIAVSA